MMNKVHAVGLAVLTCSCAVSGSPEITTPRGTGVSLEIIMPADVPVPPSGALPVYAMKQAVAPREELLRVLKLNYPNVELTSRQKPVLERTLRRRILLRTVEEARVDGRLVAMVDQTGDVALMPRLADLSSLQKSDSPKLEKSARASLQRLNLQQGQIEKQANIRAEFDAPLYVFRSERNKDDTNEDVPVPELMYMKARRMVGEYPVVGRGSKATVSIDARGLERGYTRTWRSAQEQAGVAKAPSRAEIEQTIRRQLRDSGVKRVKIETIDIVYYDANAKYLQPAYRAFAYLDKGGKRDLVVIGYVGFSSELVLDKLPTLEKVGAAAPNPLPPPAPSVPPVQPQPPVQPLPQPLNIVPAGPPPLRVGRFVARGNGDLPFRTSAENFWLDLAPEPLRFQNAVYAPEATSQALKSSAGALDLVLVEGHGFPAIVFMNSSDGDEVRFGGTDPIQWPAASVAGRAADWILHSCEVVAAPPDRPSHWADPWWSTLGNVRSLVGYRTRMEVADQVVEEFGDRLRDNQAIVSAWLSTVGDYYTSGQMARVSSDVMRPLGRPAALTVCGHENDTINTERPRQAARCIRIRYYDDVL